MSEHDGTKTLRLLRTAAAVAIAAAVGVACSEAGPTAVQQGQSGTGLQSSHTGGPSAAAHFTLCKEGTSATFDVSVDGTPSTVSLAAGECTELAEAAVIPGEPTPEISVTVTEQSDPAIQLDSIIVESVTLEGTSSTKLTGTNTVTELIDDDRGIKATFYNSLVPTGGGEGCTPGYWRQEHHFDSWEGYAPSDLFSGVFDLPSALQKPETLDPDMTLLDALVLRGGGVNALTRHAVAALLNASSSGVSYDLTEPEVIAAYNAAIGGGDIEGTKDELEGFNEQGCPLN